ncbi:MAG TPA: hypothetical protein VFL60_04330 [Gaiellaceae bacterium]|nr:hypothetical protein [Gaiellaceae bacterium]
MRSKLALLLVGAAVVFVAAACGGSGGSSSSTTASGTTTSAAATPAQEKAAVKRVWTAFFSSKTSAKQKAAYLQNGQKFEQAIREQAQSPLASHTSATVKSVTLQGPAKAKVVYSIDLAGRPALTNQTGTAVKVNGLWQVGDASFCTLLGLGGKVPAGCKNVG